MIRVVVVGAGVLGASTAFHLAVAGGAKVVLIDQAHAGRATAAGAGIVCPWASAAEDADWHRIAQAGARYYPTLVQLLAECGESELGYRRVGALCVTAEQRELNYIEQVLRTRRAEAPEMGEVSRLSPEQARRLFPPLREDFAAMHISGGARVDGRLLEAALRRGMERRGGQFQTGMAELLAEAGRVTGVRVDTGMVPADRVVVAAGAWAPVLLAPLGLALAVAPQRGQITHLRMEGVETGSWPVVLPPGSHYLLAFDAGRVVVGATREAGAGFDFRVTAAGQAEVLNQALAIAPGLAPATLIETRVGFRPIGPDNRPMLGQAAALDGLVIGNGLGPSGLTIGPYAGRLLAQVALGTAPEMDLSPYDPERTRPGAASSNADRVR